MIGVQGKKLLEVPGHAPARTLGQSKSHFNLNAKICEVALLHDEAMLIV